MNNTKASLNNALLAAIVVVGAVTVSAVVFNYSGSIQLKFGPDGIQTQIKGNVELP